MSGDLLPLILVILFSMVSLQSSSACTPISVTSTTLQQTNTVHTSDLNGTFTFALLNVMTEIFLSPPIESRRVSEVSFSQPDCLSGAAVGGCFSTDNKILAHPRVLCCGNRQRCLVYSYGNDLNSTTRWFEVQSIVATYTLLAQRRDNQRRDTIQHNVTEHNVGGIVSIYPFTESLSSWYCVPPWHPSGPDQQRQQRMSWEAATCRDSPLEAVGGVLSNADAVTLTDMLDEGSSWNSHVTLQVLQRGSTLTILRLKNYIPASARLVQVCLDS